MRILLINPPHTAIGSRIPPEHLPPLGLLAIGGPLRDDGHDVTLLDAEIGPLSQEEIVRRVVSAQPEAILLGHSGSTSAHPTVCELTRRFREVLPTVKVIYGG
ncbi:MAG TPA: cobalamin-dependent protein, partial [Gammaproteobacteria bacterium]